MYKIKGQKPDPMVPPLSMYGLFLVSSMGHWNQIVADENALEFTRKELKDDIKTLAKAMLEMGVGAGDVVQVATGRSMYASIVIFYAANRLGATACFHDEQISRSDLLFYMKEFKAPILFTWHWGGERIKRLQNDAPTTLKWIVNITAEHNQKTFKKSILETFEVSGKTLPGSEAEHSPRMIMRGGIPEIAAMHRGWVPMHLFDGKREALISFTSGSTSGPKPMVFTNKNLLAVALISKQASDVKMWDPVLKTWMGTVHLDCPYGLVVSILSPISGGDTVILTPEFSDETLNYYLDKRPNVIFAVPSIVEDIPKLLDPKVDVSGLRMLASGGERLSKEASDQTLEFLKERGAKHLKMANGYGVGEALGMVSTAVGKGKSDPTTVGKVPAGVHVMVIDPETGEELTQFGKVGLVCVTGEHILKRYFNRPELDAEKFVYDGKRRFVNTGDLGSVSPSGYVTLVGRASFFMTGLRTKVYYNVVRSAVMNSELVEECYVVGGPDPEQRQASYAFVVVADGVKRDNQTRQEIIEASKQPFRQGQSWQTLKDFEMPRKVIFLDELPLTPNNKVDYRKLERMARRIGGAEDPLEQAVVKTELADEGVQA